MANLWPDERLKLFKIQAGTSPRVVLIGEENHTDSSEAFIYVLEEPD